MHHIIIHHITSHHIRLPISLGREKFGVVHQEHETGEVNSKLQEHSQYGVYVEDVGQGALL